MYRFAILTVSDRATTGEYTDHSGPLIAEYLQEHTNWLPQAQTIVPDEQPVIVHTLQQWVTADIALILTTGGTGFAPRDITPEATRQVIEREAPGLAEALRAESLKITRHAMLSRAVAGIAAQTLIINLPGSPKAVRESLDILMPVLPHALDLLRSQPQANNDHRSV
ncbi:MAG TPA: MogA/MoaB family molybdenum cofactor biosynthesis protein [Anaerolineae bacterium]|nr:MogA/MoaB family molybdenum cofactor biosynthesis protein [Anaerolineae bacterium]